MEVQDTNNFLQRLLNMKLGGAASVSTQDGGFAEMLNFDARPEEMVAETKPALREDVKVDDNVDSKRDFAVKDDRNDKQNTVKEKDDEPVRREDKKTRKSNEADNGEAAVQATESSRSRPAAEEKQAASAQSGGATPAGDKVVAAANTAAQTSVQAASETVVAQIQGTVMPEILGVPQLMADGSEMPMVVSDKLPASGNAPDQSAAALMPAGDDALLLEQAQYLDEKVAAAGKLKIDVNVQEAKIAEPVVKDILQNRFEIDSLFQNVDIDALAENADVQLLSDEGNPLLNTAKNTAPVAPDSQLMKGFAAVDNQFQPQLALKETASRPAGDNASVLAVSGKEVVFETANAARTETFTRLNETTSRDAFKGMGKEVVEQIKVNITKSAVKGVDTIDIQLKPEDLGKIQIKMHIAKDGRLHAEIISSRPETMDMLQKDIAGLEKAFNDAGYDTDSRSFNFSFQKENQAGEQQKADSGLLQFIGDALEQEAESTAGNDNLEWDPVLGLNIRV